MNYPDFNFANITIVAGIIIFSAIWLYIIKSKTKNNLSLSLLLVIIFLVIRFSLQYINDDTPKMYLYLHVTSLLVLSYAVIRTIVKVFIGDFLTKHHKINIPKIFQDLMQICAFLIVAIILLKENLKLDTSIIVTSSVLSIVIGLALQDTLGNFFSGLALQMQRPFEEGDWIKFHDEIGQIKEIDWRSVRIMTLNHDYVVMPNSEISKSTFINYSKPTRLHRIIIPIGVSYDTPPNLLKDIVTKIAVEEPEVLSHPTPTILLVKYNDFSIDYELRVFTETFNRFKEITDSIYTKMWYQFKRHNIKIPFPIRDVYMYEVNPPNAEERRNKILSTLKNVDFLSPLSDEEVATLADGVEIKKYASGEAVIKQGNEGNSFYLINSGEVEVIITDEKGENTTIGRLLPSAFFGELSLLTGSPRTATVVASTDCEFIVINADIFRSIIMNDPEIADKISDIITKRQLELEESTKSKTSEELSNELKEKSFNLLQKMKNFFGL